MLVLAWSPSQRLRAKIGDGPAGLRADPHEGLGSPLATQFIRRQWQSTSALALPLISIRACGAGARLGGPPPCCLLLPGLGITQTHAPSWALTSPLSQRLLGPSLRVAATTTLSGQSGQVPQDGPSVSAETRKAANSA